MRQDDAVGPRPLQLGHRLGDGGAGLDVDIRPQPPRRKGDIGVIRIRAHGGNQAAGPLDTGQLEDVVPGGVAVEIDIVGLFQQADALRPVIDDDKGCVLFLEGAGNLLADPSVAAENEMPLQAFDFILHLTPLPYGADITLDDVAHDAAQGIEGPTHAAEHEEDAEDTPAVAELVHLPVADGGDGGDRHVDGVEEIPALDNLIADDADDNDGRQPENAQ